MPGVNEYQYDGKDLQVTDAMKADFDRDGFVVIRNLLSQQELDLLEEAVTGEKSLTSYAYGRESAGGGVAKMCLWNRVGRDTTGAISSTRKLAGTASKLLGREVYHYHSKLMMKDAKTGGNFRWHQDYGRWYKFGCLYPDMLSIFVALDRCDTENGCLHVMRGSHRCGRIHHERLPDADQEGPDPKKLAVLESRLETVPMILKPGDAAIYHCNIFQRSHPNDSDRRRWSLITAYSCTDNNTPDSMVYSDYVPLVILDNDAVINTGVSRDLTGKDVLVKHPGEWTFTHYFQ